MDRLSKQLFTIVSTAVDNFIDKLSEEFELDKEKVMSVWNESAGDELKVVPVKKAASGRGRKKAEDEDPSKKCQHELKKGHNPGSLCGGKISPDSVSGKYCRKHLNQESKTSTSSAQTKTPKTKAAKKVEDKPDAASAAKPFSESPAVKLKINKWKRYQDETSGYLFDRKTDEVYGKESGDGAIVDLTAEDISQCKILGFKYRLPERLVSAKDKEEEEEEGDMEEEEEEEEEEEDEDEN